MLNVGAKNTEGERERERYGKRQKFEGGEERGCFSQ